ncbi:uncharacterized protein FOMMEDRAFT_140172 [Fomitiporia mediterranea MF3/22]|uniref:uncharacterized protein n=1 Tax=Fomitiporia mediterranea (strain MF3/22) TaxID=694068 RepID=UPI0004409846|nr:uncharacterized protein FOMMEDRAFT_140172 [Fomitiporia mediterranea MF3/22]EJD04107.1 hypothetical protein FOMMEDRAFT_140172 [Fomitiporia mediterranea MF3/22]
MLPPQSRTPVDLLSLPSKKALCEEFVGKPLSDLRTPALVVDRAVFTRNCARMLGTAHEWGADFRAHLKSHKTAEGARLQLVTSVGQTHAVIVSTLMEAWQVLRSGLVAEGVVKDILYGMPISVNKIADISALSDELSKHGAVLRLHVDHPDQIAALEAFESQRTEPRRRSVFVKVDCGDKRAGIPVTSILFEAFLSRLISSPVVSIHGFYSHQGGSYASASLDEAAGFLSRELEAVNTAAGLALALLAGAPEVTSHSTPFVLSVGSTPTMHAATADTKLKLKQQLNGLLELHAGNYPLLDLQQLGTSLISPNRISQSVLATVVSYYPGRGANGEDEAMVDAGAIAMSKDKGPIEGFGEVVGKKWRLSRISQEHGILTRTSASVFESSGEDSETLTIGEQVQIVGQHACLIFAAYPWIYVCDSDSGKPDTVVDVWVTWKGW